MENFTTFDFICIALIFLCVACTIIGLFAKKKSIRKLQTDVIYWKQQWETANNISIELQKKFDSYDEEIEKYKNQTITISSEVDFDTKKSMKQIVQLGFMKLQGKIINSGCLHFKNENGKHTINLMILKHIILK